MDEGPFRASRPADRRAVNRSEPAYRQPEEQQPVRQEPLPAERAPSHRNSKDNKPSRRFKLPIILIVILVIILGVAGWLVFSNNKNSGTAIDSSKYQAVFFTNGQVYFGKLSPLDDSYMKLTDIYYLQTQAADEKTGSNPQQTSTDKSNVQLIKLGEEIHGPEDEMVLSRDQVLFYENLKADGKVGQSIEAYKKSH